LSNWNIKLCMMENKLIIHFLKHLLPQIQVFSISVNDNYHLPGTRVETLKFFSDSCFSHLHINPEKVFISLSLNCLHSLTLLTIFPGPNNP
jgi:hypothetical protein